VRLFFLSRQQWGRKCCNQAWLLKKSIFLPNRTNLGDAKCLEKRKSRLKGILAQSFFSHFLVSEFFNSHGI